MKKAYVKPWLGVESFQLDAAVAASCGSEGKAVLNFQAANCNLYMDTEKMMEDYIFGGPCAENIVTHSRKGDPNDTLCYHAFQIKMANLTMYS